MAVKKRGNSKKKTFVPLIGTTKCKLKKGKKVTDARTVLRARSFMSLCYWKLFSSCLAVCFETCM